jgi:ABC-type oligopeptide transport system substrate-binding subunit
MAAAGYPEGRGPDGRPLTLYLDHAAGGEAAFASIFDWLRARFRLLGIEMRERGTELSRYREKVETGNLQLFRQGWMADYPDPENFLFLFYGPNAKLASKGQNLCNYSNPEYDALFERMEGMMDGPERKAVIDAMVDILRRDAPMVWGMHPTSYLLSHAWYANSIPPGMTGNWGKFVRIDAQERVERQTEWNRPVVWPVIALAGLALAALAPLTLRSVVASRRRRAGKGAV